MKESEELATISSSNSPNDYGPCMIWGLICIKWVIHGSNKQIVVWVGENITQ